MEIKLITPRLAPMRLLLDADPSPERVAAYLHDSWCYAAYLGEEIAGEEIVAEEIVAKEIVGVCVVKRTSEKTAELFNIAVETEHRAKGIGTRLLRFALDDLKKRSLTTVELGTGTFGYQLTFYQRLGFRVDSVIKNFFIDNYPEPVMENGLRHKDMLRLICTLT